MISLDIKVPNEHITFAADPIQKSRSEDAIIAYTWDHFLKDPTTPDVSSNDILISIISYSALYPLNKFSG